MLPQPPQPTQQPNEGRPDARAMLIDILTKAMRMAEQNGLNFEEIVQEVLKGKGSESRPVPPPPPAPPM